MKQGFSIQDDQIVAVIRNVTDQRQALKRSKQSRGAWRTSLNFSPMPPWSRLRGQGDRLERAIESMTGVRAEEMMGKVIMSTPAALWDEETHSHRSCPLSDLEQEKFYTNIREERCDYRRRIRNRAGTGKSMFPHGIRAEGFKGEIVGAIDASA